MTETAPHAPTPKRRFSWGKIVLFASLAFNLLIVGLVAGAMLGGPRDRDRNPMMRDLGFGPFVHALSGRDRKELTRAIEGASGSFRDNRAALRTDFEAFLTAVRADPFDPAALEQVIDRQKGRVHERQGIGQKLLLVRITEMSVEDRAAYADKLDELLRRGSKRSRK